MSALSANRVVNQTRERTTAAERNRVFRVINRSKRNYAG